MLRRSNRNRTSALPSRWLKFVEIILIEVQKYLQAGNNGHGCGLGLWIQFDWTAWLGAIDTILESTWVVSSASGLTTHSPSISSDGRVTTVWLKSGNASGAVYSATNHIKTAAGREGERSLRVTIVDR